jgi:hypothetical protein
VNEITTALPKSMVVEGALALGFSLAEAIQRALSTTITRFAQERGYRQVEVSMCLNAYEGRVYAIIRDDIAAALGVSRERVDGWIEAQSARNAAQKRIA